MESRPSFFSFRAPLRRAAWLGQGAAATAVFVAALCAMQIALAAFLPPWMGPLFALIFFMAALIAAAVNPLVVLALVGGVPAAEYALGSARLPQCSAAFGAPLAILFALVALVFCLRLIALAVRRRRDAGTSAAWVPFLFGSLYGLFFIWAVGISMEGERMVERGILWGALTLLAAIHAALFLRPSRPLPPAP